MKEYIRLAFNTIIIAVGNISSRSILFLLLPLFTRYMKPAEYGKLDVINTTISLLVPILSLQITESVFRFAIDVRGSEKGKKVLSNAILFSFFSLLLSIAFYPILRRIEIFVQYSVHFYLIFLLTVLTGIAKQFVRGLGLVKVYAASDILYSAVFAISNVVLLVMMPLGIRAYLLSMIIASTASIAFIVSFGRLWKYLVSSIDKGLLREMLSYSVPLIPNGIMWWVITAADRYFLSFLIDYEATGLYSIAAKFPYLLTTLFTIFSQAWQLSAIEEYGKNGYPNFFRNIFRMLSSLIFLASSLLLTIIKPFIKFYVGTNYFESWRYVIFLFLGAVFQIFAHFYGVNYGASRKTMGAFTTSALAAGTKLVTILLLIRKLGIQAASLSTFFAYFVMWVARVLHTRKIVGVTLDVKHVILSLGLILTQGILLLMLEYTIILYLIQISFLLIMLTLQWKYLSRLIRFGKKLLKARKRRIGP